jgi:hypothetical protein
MTTDGARLHVTFGYSAAGSLKMALATLGLSEEVAILGDDYSMGPIDPGDADQRAAWEREELGEDDPIAISDDVAAFWERVSTWPGKLVAWMSSHSVVELCGLHELVWRLPTANIDVIDVSNVDFRSGNASRYDARQAFAIVRDDYIVELSLIDSAKSLSDVERASYRRAWNRLRAENAPLRVLTETGLVSAAVDHFDDRIRARIAEDWQRCARVVGDMLASVSSGTLREGGSDTFFFVRLLYLTDADDDIECRNDDGPDALWSMRSSWVRRRPRA